MWIYRLSDFSYQGVVTLSPALAHIQGIEYKNGVLYISTDGKPGKPDNGVHLYNVDGTKISDIITVREPGEIEGVYVEGTDIYLNIAGTIYRYLLQK